MGQNEIRVGLPRGVKWCKSEGEKQSKSWAAKGVKRCKSEGVIFSGGVK